MSHFDLGFFFFPSFGICSTLTLDFFNPKIPLNMTTVASLMLIPLKSNNLVGNSDMCKVFNGHLRI